MPYSNYIFEYYAAIKSGKITAGRWILAAYRMIIDGLAKSAFFFDARKATKAVQFIEGFCHHFEGGEGLLKLELWQAAEQMYKAAMIQADERKDKAREIIYECLKVAQIEGTPDVEKVVDGLIEAAAFALPKTGVKEPEAPEPAAEAQPEQEG